MRRWADIIVWPALTLLVPILVLFVVGLIWLEPPEEGQDFVIDSRPHFKTTQCLVWFYVIYPTNPAAEIVQAQIEDTLKAPRDGQPFPYDRFYFRDDRNFIATISKDKGTGPPECKAKQAMLEARMVDYHAKFPNGAKLSIMFNRFKDAEKQQRTMDDRAQEWERHKGRGRYQQ